MEQNSYWEANSCSASQEIPCLLCNPKFHFRAHNISLLFSVLNHESPVHKFPPHFSNTHSNIILLSVPVSPKWSLPFRFPDQNFVHISHLSHPSYISAQLIILDLITLITLGVEYKLYSSSLCSLLQRPATFTPLGPNILLGTLFPNTLSLRVSSPLFL